MEQPQQQPQPETSWQDRQVLPRCAFDPEVETGLACGKCGKYICPRCMIQTPVGARCRECARVTKLPTFDVGPSHYLRASIAGGLVAVVAGTIWSVVPHGIPFLPWLLAMATGHLVGEAISLSVNRKRGPALVTIAALSMTLAILVSRFLPPLHGPSIIFWVLIVGVAYYIAIRRVR